MAVRWSALKVLGRGLKWLITRCATEISAKPSAVEHGRASRHRQNLDAARNTASPEWTEKDTSCELMLLDVRVCVAGGTSSKETCQPLAAAIG